MLSSPKHKLSSEIFHAICAKGSTIRSCLVHRCPLTAVRSPLSAHRSPLTAHRSPLSAHRSPLTAHRSPLTAHRSPLTAHRCPFTANSCERITVSRSLRRLCLYRDRCLRIKLEVPTRGARSSFSKMIPTCQR